LAAAAAALALVLAAILGAAVAAGCARVALPEEDLAGRLGHGEEERRRWRPDPAWWRAYGDGRLDALVDLALERNPDVASAVISAARAAVQAGLSERDLWPDLSAGGSASVRRNLGESAPSSRSFGTSLSLGWEIDLWRRAASAATAAGLESLASASDLEAARQSLANKVVDAYFSLAYLHDALAESERALGSLLAVESIVAVKHSSGQAAAVEPVQAAQSVLQARDAVLSARHQLEAGRSALRALLNLPPGEDPPLGEPSLAGVAPAAPDLGAPLSVLANRPDLLAAELRLRKAFAVAKDAPMAWLPTISLSSAISAGGGALGLALSDPVGSLGLSLGLPFLDWSRISKNVRLSELEFESAKLAFETALTAALNEVDLAIRHRGTLSGLLENSRRRHRLSVRVREHYRERYLAGAGELSDLISAVDSANSARLSVLSATWQLIAADNLIYKAMSGRYVDLGPGAGETGAPDASWAPASTGALEDAAAPPAEAAGPPAEDAGAGEGGGGGS
jgi:outer membrane protein TolC